MKKIAAVVAIALAAYAVPVVGAHAQVLSAQEMTGTKVTGSVTRAWAPHTTTPERGVRQPQARRTGSFFGCTTNLSGHCQRMSNSTGKETSSLLRY